MVTVKILFETATGSIIKWLPTTTAFPHGLNTGYNTIEIEYDGTIEETQPNDENPYKFIVVPTTGELPTTIDNVNGALAILMQSKWKTIEAGSKAYVEQSYNQNMRETMLSKDGKCSAELQTKLDDVNNWIHSVQSELMARASVVFGATDLATINAVSEDWSSFDATNPNLTFEQLFTL